MFGAISLLINDAAGELYSLPIKRRCSYLYKKRKLSGMKRWFVQSSVVILGSGLLILPGCSHQGNATSQANNQNAISQNTKGVDPLKTGGQHKIIYKVQGAAAGQWLWIKYLAKPTYDDPSLVQAKPGLLTSVRVPAKALPWTTQISLPEKAVAWVWAANAKGQKSHLSVSIIDNGEEFVTKPLNPDPVESLSSIRGVGESCCS